MWCRLTFKHTERARPLLPLHLTFGDVKSSRILLAQIEPFTTVLNQQLKTSRLVIERASFNWQWRFQFQPRFVEGPGHQ
jgi:hypothetical protein